MAAGEPGATAAEEIMYHEPHVDWTFSQESFALLMNSLQRSQTDAVYRPGIDGTY